MARSVLSVGLVLAAASAFAAGDRSAATALAARAESEAAAGDLAAAVHTLERAETAAPDWPELKVNLAALKSRAGDFAGAIRAARAALELAPSLEGARVNLGLAQLKAGDPVGADETLARYRGRGDVPPSVHVGLGLADAALDRPAECVAELRLAVTAGVRDPGVLYALARARREIGDATGAAEARALLAESAPGSAARHMLEGDALDSARDWPGAEDAYRRALEADERFPGAHHSLGLVLYKRRAYDEAALEFGRELANQPRYAPALYYQALLELDRGRAAEAVPLLERATTAVPGMKDAWRDLGRALLEARQPRAAIEPLGRAVTLDAEDARAFFLLSRALEGAGQKSAADEARKRATELNRKRRQELKDGVSGSEPR